MKQAMMTTEAGFRVLTGTDRSQAAVMVLRPGESTGGPDNHHERSDQWLFVLSGTGKAVVNGREIDLAEHVLVLIESGENHEIRSDGEVPLVTLNFYVPPVY